MAFDDEFMALLEQEQPDYTVLGFLTKDGSVYPLGTDTKVLSTVFEAFARPLVYRAAEARGLTVWEPTTQNSYPDFTLMADKRSGEKIAVDVKTTYEPRRGANFSFTLGGYTSFLRNENKNIEFPYSHYTEHWIIGYVYRRSAAAERLHSYASDDLTSIPPPYEAVEVFVQKKWKIAGDSAGSGNTTNIGSIRGTLADFRAGRGPFSSSAEYLDYWRNYGRTAAERMGKFKNVREYRRWKAAQGT